MGRRADHAFVIAAFVCLFLALHPRPTSAERRPPLTPEGLPNIFSESAFVLDLDTGALVYAKNPDQPREIASTGKIFVAMAVRARRIDLATATPITAADRDSAMGGARSRLPVGAVVNHRDLLAAMLIASDNRACTALGRAVGLDTGELVEAMGNVARELGLRRTTFADPAGLQGNVSTAREMARAFAAALEDPVIAEISGTAVYDLAPGGGRPVRYRNTNDLIHRDPEVFAGKTGYTDAARYCLLVAAEIGGRRLVLVFLGADGKKTRFADYRRMRHWLQQ